MMQPKRRQMIAALNSQKAYSPADIADFAEENGWIKGKNARKNLRTSLSAFSKNHLPDEHDELSTRPRQSPVRAWYGWRWKKAAEAD